jgi:hypothetical protein
VSEKQGLRSQKRLGSATARSGAAITAAGGIGRRLGRRDEQGRIWPTTKGQRGSEDSAGVRAAAPDQRLGRRGLIEGASCSEAVALKKAQGLGKERGQPARWHSGKRRQWTASSHGRCARHSEQRKEGFNGGTAEVPGTAADPLANLDNSRRR